MEMKGAATIKNEYLKIHSENFLFKKDGKAIGWFMGEMDDFETFYMRNTGILPKYQGQGLYTELLPHLLSYLKALGYQRVSSHHSSDNIRIFNLKMKQGFMIVGSENHERYGQLVKMVKIFNKEREQIYKTRFKG